MKRDEFLKKGGALAAASVGLTLAPGVAQAAATAVRPKIVGAWTGAELMQQTAAPLLREEPAISLSAEERTRLLTDFLVALAWDDRAAIARAQAAAVPLLHMDPKVPLSSPIGVGYLFPPSLYPDGRHPQPLKRYVYPNTATHAQGHEISVIVAASAGLVRSLDTVLARLLLEELWTTMGAALYRRRTHLLETVPLDITASREASYYDSTTGRLESAFQTHQVLYRLVGHEARTGDEGGAS